MTQPGRLDWIETELETLSAQQLRRFLAVRQSPQATEVEFSGQKVVNFGSNDYLGLASEPLQGQLPGNPRAGNAASPLLGGRSSLHARLESELAEFEEAEAALLFSSGYAANVGAITSLVGREDLILSDAKNHASIIDGCRLSRATIRIYAHNDLQQLKTLLGEAGSFRRRLIVTDSLFSMDGDLAQLDRIAELARQHQAMLMVDEAHATGVFGASGRGVAELQQVDREVDVRVGTLSKAFGCSGGFVAGSTRLIEWLANKARTYVFSTAAPEPVLQAALDSLQVIRAQPERRENLLRQAESFRSQLRADGWNVGQSQSQIIPIYLGDAGETMRMSAQLLEQGFYVPGIRPPSVPQGESLLRLCLSARHTAEQFASLCDKLRGLRR